MSILSRVTTRRITSALGLCALALVGLASDASEAGDGVTRHAPRGWYVQSAADTSVEWDSGKTKRLSSWRTVDCYEENGAAWLARGLRAWAEPGKNLDAFVAKLSLTCGEFRTDDLHFRATTTKDYHRVYESRHGTKDGKRLVQAHELPVGIYMKVNRMDGYVYGMSMGWVELIEEGRYGYWQTPNWDTSVVPHRHGKVEELRCPVGQVLSGLSLRYDTRNGKIRRVRLVCRELRWEPGQ